MVENYTKDLKESVYHGAVVSALAIGYMMLGKAIIKMSPPSLVVFIAFRVNGITSGSYICTNAIIGNHNRNTAKSIAFYKTYSSLGLLITYNGSHVSVADDKSTLIYPDYRFPSPKSNCTILNKWQVISVTWSNHKNLSNCWSNGEKLMTFNTGIIEGSNHSFMLRSWHNVC